MLIAIAKSVAAALSGSASMVAEAAHSWADTGNEILLMIANRRAARPGDRTHPLGYGREVYIWSMFAAIGLFALGAGVSITHGIHELQAPEPADDFLLAYLVLGISFVLEGISFRQSYRQLQKEAKDADRSVVGQALRTSDPTVRAVFAEDAAALVGLIIAAIGILAHQLTGSPVPDAIGSILVGVLLGGVALMLIDRNRRFLVGEQAAPRVRLAMLATLRALPEVDRVTYLRTEFVGPRQLYVVAGVDLVGDFAEAQVARTLRTLEKQLEEDPRLRKVVLTLATPEEAEIDA
ncbi:cation diffusion facilitator family transporter [Skermania piniformis]|uniref:Cation diffusion facilitator family transporter n=1 Tax=Skermania pinensis TaxID=39122 RepID=A0ABX8SDP7_9ACTN|nr:cation diffusion facilitator family transporter [Skermania piniformis]QXQ16060.1 cation diffusion facilitator family transporter [Skermania piniformis]